jgi:hypothetical protein
MHINHPQKFLKSLKSMYLNATSLDNKLDEFKVVIETYGPKKIGVSETWFKSYSIVDVNGYNIYRKILKLRTSIEFKKIYLPML